MSNPIPPFVCSTPPPIDCIAEIPPAVEDDFGDFAAVDDQFEASSLPVTPVHIAKLPEDNAHKAIHSSTPPSPDSVLNFTPSVENDRATTLSSYAPVPSKVDLKNDLPYIIEANSPPPLDFEPADDDLTPCDDLDNDDEADEIPLDDVGKYDDNISLPSLKFDSLSNISKSTTPVSDELTKSNPEDLDSISAFQSIPAGELEEDANVMREDNSSPIGKVDEENEVKSIPFEALTINKEADGSENCGNSSVLRESSNEHDEDFTEFEAFPTAPPLEKDTKPVEDEPPPDDDVQKNEVQESSDFAFEADFSQFSSFEPVSAVPFVAPQIIEKRQLTERSSLDDLDADDFDDFQDFAVPTQVVEQRQLSIEENTAPSTSIEAQEPSEIANNSDDDDEFGEFSEIVEYSETKIPSSNSGFNLANLNDKLKPILEMMFPVANEKEEESERSLNDLKQLTTSTTIDQIDTAKALEYQWNNSEVRHSLIKSLGVDSRNILYGEKWNSSMPRYAANLSFNPLEPMKSDKSAAGSSAASSTIDYRKRSDSLTPTSTTSKADVPAVEFDWNSSGLVNPLDASQAHTLLLDLDQLVVVANLDKINLDSSCSSPCFATPSPSTSLISSVTAAALDVATHSITITPSHAAGGDDGHSDLLAIDVQPQNDLLLITMSSPPTCSSSPSPSPSSSLLLPSPCNSSVFVSGTCRTETFLNNNDKPTNDHVNHVTNDNCTTSTTTTTTTATNIFANLGSNDHNFNQYLDCRVKEILHERTIEAIHPSQLGESHSSVDQQSNSTFNSNNNIYDSDKPLRRFIDEETISTTIEFKSNADASATISTTTTTAAAATATQPTATATPAAPATLPDDYIDITCGDFHPSVLETNLDTVIANPQALNYNTHAAKYQESSKTDLETELQHSGVVTTSTYAGPLKETHIFTPSKSESILTRSSSKTPRTSESKCPIDFDYEIAAAGIIIDETVVKKEYRDVEYNPGFGLKYREEAEYKHSPSPENDRDAFSSNGPPPMQSYLNNELPNRTQFAEKPSGLDDFSDFVSVVSEKMPEKKTTAKAIVPKSNSFDDEFSDFQSVPAPVAPTIVPSAIIPSSVVAESKTSPSHWRKLKETELSSSGSRTGTPVSLCDEMILSPAILLPQAIQMQQNKPKIEWPEPGINPEEMARIEELFPQPKVGSNKPSPSHSGRSQQKQNQQNRATPQSGADDDDWSDFVSVPAPENQIQSISQQFQKRHVSPAKSASDQNDEEWSDFVSSAPPPAANHMRQSVYPQFNSAAWQNANFYNNPMSAYASPPTSFYYQPPPPQPQQQQNLSNNLVPNLSNVNNNTATNNNIINNNSINQYLINNQANQSHHHHHQHQQHIQMMRDFSSSSPMDGGSLPSHLTTPPSIHHQYAIPAATGYKYGSNRGGGVANLQHYGKSSQFGGGSSKVAPSISLIPDLGFVAPTHTSFISVPKNSFIAKK